MAGDFNARDDYGRNLNEIIVELCKRGAIVDTKNRKGLTALHKAAMIGYQECVQELLRIGAMISNIREYAPVTNSRGTLYTDCRPLIRTEIQQRRRRSAFDSFISNHIEHRPYIDSIYSMCFPSGDLRVAEPSVGWPRAETVRNKFYFDEIFYYLHLHVANVLTKKEPTTTQVTTTTTTTTSTVTTSYGTDTITTVSTITHAPFDSFSTITELANNRSDTATLMTVLSQRLKFYLKPDTSTVVVDSSSDDDDDDDDDDDNDDDNDDDDDEYLVYG
jgi:ankyrin repeat protein